MDIHMDIYMLDMIYITYIIHMAYVRYNAPYIYTE